MSHVGHQNDGHHKGAVSEEKHKHHDHHVLAEGITFGATVVQLWEHHKVKSDPGNATKHSNQELLVGAIAVVSNYCGESTNRHEQQEREKEQQNQKGRENEQHVEGAGHSPENGHDKLEKKHHHQIHFHGHGSSS